MTMNNKSSSPGMQHAASFRKEDLVLLFCLFRRSVRQMQPLLERSFCGSEESISFEDAFPDQNGVVFDSSMMATNRRYTQTLRKSWSWTRTKLVNRHLVIASAILNFGISLAAV